MKKLKYFCFILTLILFVSNLSAQMGPYSVRALLEKNIYYIVNGKIQSAKYWAIPLGLHELKLTRKFPGEGDITFDANINFNFLSSGYIEGTGYGDRGKVTANATFAVMEGDSLRNIELGEIDYVFWGCTKVKLKNSNEIKDLYIDCEGTKLTPKRASISVWKFDKVYKELKHYKDFDRLMGFSFTKQGALNALKAQKREAAKQE